MIFAQIPEATPLGIGNLLVDGAAVMAIVLIFLKIVEHFKEKPPLDRQLHALRQEFGTTYATKTELQSSLQSVRDQISGSDARATEARAELQRNVQAIFDLLRSLSREISHMQGRMDKTQSLRPPGDRP